MYQSVVTTDAGGGSTAPTTFKVQVEKIRFIAYLSFWGMCLFAMIYSDFTVAPNLGPCPASPGAEPTYGMHCSALMETFGFNNVSNVVLGYLKSSLLAFQRYWVFYF